ncbi:hypothetical protein DSO57_1024871 [Entomophthora muscae]|uniref:Uncharacterized protein n=1 Tax=Entomophthora muscae TaxID=34485 RepID=A0ACC2S4N1_9FUNG|nr:hypothetical protein DSO57_1024871 [Entomophthora muscae]
MENRPSPILVHNPSPSPSKSFTEQPKITISSGRKGSAQLLSGCSSGLITCLLFQPFDLIKTRQQQHTPQLSPVALATPISTKRLGLSGHISQVIAKDGVLGLWRGTIPTIMRNVPGMGMYFFTFEKMKAGVGYLKAREPTRVDQLVCGAGARAFVGFLLMPISVVKVQVESSHYPNITNARQGFRSILSSQGVAGLFAGSGATALRDAPYAGIYIYFYELAKSILNPRTEQGPQSPNLACNLVSGVGAGFAATLLTHPFDVVKTRIQLDKQRYPNFLVGLRSMALSELTSGLTMRLTRKSLSSAISWAGYEQFVSWSTYLFSSRSA